MVSTGILLKSDAMRIITLSGTINSHSRISKEVHKLNLPLSSTKDEIDIFIHTLKAYCNDYQVNQITLNYRNSKGRHSGGAATFRNEGVIFAVSPASVKIVHPSTLAATERKNSALKSERPVTKDLGVAYDLAFEGLKQ